MPIGMLLPFTAGVRKPGAVADPVSPSRGCGRSRDRDDAIARRPRAQPAVCGGRKTVVSYEWVTAVTCIETCAAIDPTGFAVASIGIEMSVFPTSGFATPSWRYCG